tara:strand:- start:176 stop:289 length:114 start_codon:yes stop_codon:yes gene_type:complete
MIWVREAAEKLVDKPGKTRGALEPKLDRTNTPRVKPV